ncbi:MAG TPA: molybdopterin converting factor subunit 1 [Bacteroidetes bacterium]|nr:molybdopterin converting factor subunit 1 [Bacteroidota bacterium]
MKVDVKLFAVLREIAGREQVTLELPEPVALTELFEQLSADHPGLTRYQTITSFALNGEYAEPATIVNDGDEVALIPPISGG